jgi:signal transduction histidine kinase/ActR/RegA family two-component response regulator
VARREESPFDDAAWDHALRKFGDVTRLTVVVYGSDGNVVRDPINVTPLFGLFRDTGYEPGVVAGCARRCLTQIVDRPAVVVAPSYGLAVVGTSLVLAGQIVGAAVAGYAFIDFCTTAAVALLARQAGVPFDRLWSAARVTPAVPERRLVVHGELLQVLGEVILRDKLRTRQYEQQSAELVAAAKAKDEFLAVISHELRTPLTPILLRVRMLRGERDPVKIDQSAAVIERNVRIQARLVEDLLDLTRATRGAIKLTLQPVDLGREASAAVNSALETARERGIELRVVITQEPLPIQADRDRLQQIFQNILGNALKFTPPGGTVTVTISSGNGSGTVTVADTGQGITAEFLPFVFDLFRREEHGGEAGRPGLGIGLALVRRLVELHGGDIRIASDGAGSGTHVVIRLPLVGDKPAAPPPDADLVRTNRLAGLRVLVADDTADVRETVKLILEALGAAVSVARDGLERFEAVARDSPDVVVCDLQMPNMDGFEFIERLQSDLSGSRPPVIALTGTGRGKAASRTRDAGFRAHLSKPVDEAELIQAIESVRRSSA